MEIKLSGYNLDKTLIDKMKGVSKDVLTPETICAAYARISRSPLSVDQLRKQAIGNIDKARKSNEMIVYSYNHKSIAEMAVLNFDVKNVSRLAIEAIQHHRLCSYLEKSQRYQELKNDYIVPREFVNYKCARKFQKLVKLQNKTYHQIYDALCQMYFKKLPPSKKIQKLQLENKAKEDARYVTSLATQTQMGMAVNARNLEYMIQQFNSHSLTEVREIGKALYKEAHQLIPSLIKYTEPGIYQNQSYKFKAIIETLTKTKKNGNLAEHQRIPTLVNWTFNGDILLVATILYHNTNHCWLSCYDIAKQFNQNERNKLFKSLLKDLSVHDAVPRLFETIDFTFDLVVSASCFAQLKRHRMATILTNPYDLSLGIIVPESICKVGMKNEFMKVINESEKLYSEISGRCKEVADYCLTQAHKRRVLIKMNARELYHFARLRQDAHAQWDIRNIADQMVAAASEKLPLTMMLACGKDRFDELAFAVYNLGGIKNA